MGRPCQSVLPAPGLAGPAIQWGWWTQGLTRQERLAYTALRLAAFDDQRLGQTRMLEALADPITAPQGGRKKKLIDIFTFLEELGFISCEGWGQVIPREVIVNEVPRQPSDPKVCGRLEHRVLCEEQGGAAPGEVNVFIRWFSQKWSLYNSGQPYRSLRGDFSKARRLLGRFPQEELRGYVIHWFKYMDQDEYKEHTILWLARRINAIVEGYARMKASLIIDEE